MALVIPIPIFLGRFTVTTYQAVPQQTDSTPNITADGTVWDKDKIYQSRIAAISREQLVYWGGTVRYGDTIRVGNNGLWHVHDTMGTEYYSKAAGGMLPIVNFVDLMAEEVNRWEGVPVFHISSGAGIERAFFCAMEE